MSTVLKKKSLENIQEVLPFLKTLFRCREANSYNSSIDTEYRPTSTSSLPSGQDK